MPRCAASGGRPGWRAAGTAVAVRRWEGAGSAGTGGLSLQRQPMERQGGDPAVGRGLMDVWEALGEELTQQHQRKLTWGQEDAGTRLGGVGHLAEPLRVSVLDVLCPEPGNRVRAGQWGAVGCRGVAEGAALTVSVPGNVG